MKLKLMLNVDFGVAVRKFQSLLGILEKYETLLT
jgi:hypothetical protein